MTKIKNPREKLINEKNKQKSKMDHTKFTEFGKVRSVEFRTFNFKFLHEYPCWVH